MIFTYQKKIYNLNPLFVLKSIYFDFYLKKIYDQTILDRIIYKQVCSYYIFELMLKTRIEYFHKEEIHNYFIEAMEIVIFAISYIIYKCRRQLSELCCKEIVEKCQSLLGLKPGPPA